MHSSVTAPAEASAGAAFRQLMDRPDGLVTGAVWDCMTAQLLAGAGFEGLFVSGAAVSASRLGLPDFGFLGLADMADQVRAIARTARVPVFVDADTGYGNPLNAILAAQTFHAAGAAGMLLEDQTFPKRCGHLTGKAVVPVAEYLPKLRAVLDERPSPDFLVCARTDAAVPEGIDAAIERGKAFADAGADIVFVEAARTPSDIERVAGEVPGRKMFSIATGGAGATLSVADLRELGFAWIDYPAVAMGSVTHAVRRYAEAVLAAGSDAPLLELDFSPRVIAELSASARWNEIGSRYGVQEGQ